MRLTSGFVTKRVYPGKKGLYIEFCTDQDASSFYAKGLATGSRIERHDRNTVIMRFSSASNEDASASPD